MSVFRKKLNQIDGIYSDPSFDETTKKVINFYKNNPFPNYKIDDNKFTILSAGDISYLKGIKEILGYKKKILEVGCGTGQFSNYFAIGTNNLVYALDPTIESLKIAKNFSEKNNINNITYVNGSIFEDIFEENIFDLVFCSGVLHHTKDTYLGFKKCAKLVKKDGLILIGLYNAYARFSIKKIIYKIFGPSVISKFDYVLKNLKTSESEKLAWIEDKYNHPVEKSHTIEQVLKWFKENKIDPIAGIPQINNLNLYNISQEIKESGLIEAKSKFNRIMLQIGMNFNLLESDGALFCILGRKQ